VPNDLLGLLGYGESENTFALQALQPPFLLGANGRKHDKKCQKHFYFS
jgi:hypothetical protein